MPERWRVYDLGDLHEWLSRWLYCPLLGHDWRSKMNDDVCDRCRISRPRGER